MYTNHRPPPVNGVDDEYDYTAELGDGNGDHDGVTTPTPTSASAYGMMQNQAYQRSYTDHQQRQQQNMDYSHDHDVYIDEPEDDQYQKFQQQQQNYDYEDDNDFAPQNHHAAEPNEHDGDRDYDRDEPESNEPDPTDDALLDLAQLEELHHEAERMKAVGNKHMAAQEYVKAYNAYSAALQLSPVGPSSHVFLSNRAAALLSLKRYPAAATDARRAVALAPTFGKAHARLGQALYFLKDYAQAVSAYQDAVAYEPDNAVTTAYLQKAMLKLEKQQAKAKNVNSSGTNKTGGGGGDGSSVSVLTAESSMMPGAASVATDPAGQHAVMQRPYASSDEAARSAMIQATLNNNYNMEAATTASPATTRGMDLGTMPPVDAATAANNTSQNSNNHGAPTSSSVLNRSANDSAILEPDDDPEFQEALRIQQRANQFLVHKQYRQAIEEYTAALFLVPDDVQLSPDLHLGRAHALNGSRRHESAKNDAVLALKLQPESPAAYSTLAKSLFYLRDYQGAVEAFGACQELLPDGEQLGLFDQAYLEKAERALLEQDASLPTPTKDRGITSLSTSSISPVPKLPPPRFVPREEAMTQPATSTTAVARSMPKQWPQQSAHSSSRVPLKVGPEREVVCLTEALGIKLNRGTDGIVRVLSVTTTRDDTHVLRKGDIHVGDVVRQAAGVDMRRPMTNVMWGDTVALIKMAPRPISMFVAVELSPVPTSVLEEQRRAAASRMASTADTRMQSMERPSPSSGDGPVPRPPQPPPPPPTATDDTATDNTATVESATDIEPVSNEVTPAPSSDGSFMTAEEVASEPDLAEEVPSSAGVEESPVLKDAVTDTKEAEVENDIADDDEDDDDIVEVADEPIVKPRASLKVSAAPTLDTVTETVDEEKSTPASSFDMGAVNDDVANDDDDDGIESVEEEPSPSQASQGKSKAQKSKARAKEDGDSIQIPRSLRDEEEKAISGEVLFLRDSPPSYGGWDTLRWMSHNGVRKVNFTQPVNRLNSGAKKRKGLPIFWKTGGSHYEERTLIVYDEPRLILIVRRPANLEEIRQLLGLPDAPDNKDQSSDDTDWALNTDTAMESYWILESAADPVSTKLRLSPLTTSTSVAPEGADDRERSCFQLLTPSETISLSAVNVRAGAKRNEQSFSDSGAFLETLSVEASISQVICGSHGQGGDLGKTETDIAWKHQIIIGSLHSLVLSGNPSLLRDGIAHARMTASRGSAAIATGNDRVLASRVVDAVDDNGFPALYYACSHRMESAVQALVNAGADVNFRTELNGLTMMHVSARNLDDKSLSTLLSATSRPDANALDKKGRTPMYVAMVEGSVLDNGKDPAALGRCIASLQAWGGTMMAKQSPDNLRNPLSALAYMWLPEYLAVVLDYIPYRFPLLDEQGTATDLSLGALYQYPVHSAIVSLRKLLRKNTTPNRISPDRLIRTLTSLFEHGFEPNERLDPRAFGSERTSFDEFVGYSPLQIVALIALEFDASKAGLSAAIVSSSTNLLADVAQYLVGCGARMSIEPPLATRLRTKGTDPAPQETEPTSRRVEILTQKLDADKQLVALLGGDDRINAVRREWLDMKKVATTATRNLVDDASAIDNSCVAGGSDAASCAICWSVFGTLMNRKHKCRVTNRYVCDECSSKRLVQVTSEHRLSDGQFLLGRADAVKEQTERTAPAKPSIAEALPSSEQARLNVRLERLEAEEASQRESLFGGMLEAATSFVLGDETQSPKTQQPLQGLTSTLDQTRDALHERGERLAALNDKSAQMVDASSDFAKMASELRKQSEKGFFW